MFNIKGGKMVIFYNRWLLISVGWLAFCMGSVQGQSTSFKIGTATKIINPEIGQFIQGAGVKKRATKIRDNLEANGLYLSNDSTQILIVSCDLVGLEPGYNTQLREAMGVAAGISPRNVIISATHTHGGPVMTRSNYLMPVNKQYYKKLNGWLVEVAQEAVRSAQPGKIGWTRGEARLAYNRRFTWADGTHTMNGDAGRLDFTGLEGPVDWQHTALFAKDKNGSLMAILYNNTTHPTTFYGAGVFSSDFPGIARRTMRKQLGQNIPILFLNGAEGDVQPDNPFHPRPDETLAEESRRLSHLIVKETMNLYKDVTFNDDPVLKHAYKDLKVGVRLPTQERLSRAQKILDRIDAGEDIGSMKMIMAWGAVYVQKNFGDAPFDILPIHAIRIGGLAMLTEPNELYSQFGLEIKRRSPVPTTMVVGLADGDHSYVPTIYAMLGGGYSAKTSFGAHLEPETGYKIVETGSLLLNKLWDDYTNNPYKN